MRYKVKKVNYGRVHCIANCIECGWEDGDMHIAPKRARKHAEQTGHLVAVEQGINYQLVPYPPEITFNK
jgi:hypothetical protein